MAQLFAGTTGCANPMWKAAFYPSKLPAKNFLAYYSQRLNSAGINYTFRRAPSVNTIERG